MARIINIRADPADILATPEAPFTQAKPAHIQAIAATAPQEHETPVGRHFTDIQFHYLRPNETGLIAICGRRTNEYIFHSLPFLICEYIVIVKNVKKEKNI